MTVSAGATGGNTSSNPGIESIVACTFLFCVVLMQVLAGFSKAVRLGAGRVGRVVYHLAFAITVVHDFFIALAVPASLLWVAVELLIGHRDVETLLAAIVGTLWYGPDRVQNAMTNLIHIRFRQQILVAALSPYHRRFLTNNYQRQLRRWPWWTACEQNEHWNGREIGQTAEAILISDGQLRSIARRGVHMAFTGEADVSAVRAWAASLVADQARFPHSLLYETPPCNVAGYVWAGHEGTLLRRSILDISEHWTEWQWKQLATVMNGGRDKGLDHLFETGWIKDLKAQVHHDFGMQSDEDDSDTDYDEEYRQPLADANIIPWANFGDVSSAPELMEEP